MESFTAYYAHSGQCKDKSDWQPLREHLLGVAELAGRFAQSFNAVDLGGLAGLLHDLGKYTEKFQSRLDGNPARVDHSTWGARVAQERYGPLGLLLAYTIAGHHAGLANGREKHERTPLADRLKSELPMLDAIWEQELPLPNACDVALPVNFSINYGRRQFQISLLVRMLFSCLVDADFIDTENYYSRLLGQAKPHTDRQPSLEYLRERLDQYLATVGQNDSPVNPLRKKILTHVRAQAKQEPGLFSLTVPTGGGKTLTSLAFALDHAIRYGQERVIFVIPFTSVVEQNAAVFRTAFGEFGEAAVLEHHGAFTDHDKRSLEAREKIAQAMERWDNPVIVTTAVQFFESLFADRPSRCRKLHNIANSVVILDEAQTLPLPLLRPCMAMLDELALNYHCSLVLCTATQPALTAAAGFRDGLDRVRELAPEPALLYEQLRRVTIRHIGACSDKQLQEHLKSREQVLCIVNNRRHARMLYKLIANETGAMHLTTLMCAAHRREVLATVRQHLNDGLPCRLVSTSLIEAGVDVDFPTVMRAEAGLDSIAQAAGRCNRNGKFSAMESDVLVFAVDENNWSPPPELKQFAQVFRSVQRNLGGDLLAPATVESFFRELYWQRGSQELDAHDLLGLLKNSRPESLPLETIANKFHFIENQQMMIVVPYDDVARELISDLQFSGRSGMIARRLQSYLVHLPKSGFDALRCAGMLRAVAPEKYGEQFMVLENMNLYHKKYGLSWDDPLFLSAEILVV